MKGKELVGKLCWISNSENNMQIAAIVKYFNEYSEYPYLAFLYQINKKDKTDIWFKYAVPVYRDAHYLSDRPEYKIISDARRMAQALLDSGYSPNGDGSWSADNDKESDGIEVFCSEMWNYLGGKVVAKDEESGIYEDTSSGYNYRKEWLEEIKD